MHTETKFVELKKVFQTLHGPKGCLWDKKQTHASLIPHLKEEVGEFIRAVRAGDPRHIKEELGDLLLHVMFNAQIAKKKGRFDIEDVIAALVEKLKRRHPHVFGKVKVSSSRQIIANWNRIKSREKKAALCALAACAAQLFLCAACALAGTIVIVGDSQVDHEAHRKVVAAIERAAPSVVFQLGDLVNDGFSKEDWDAFNEITASLRKSAEYFPLLGNHENSSPLFFDTFTLPNNERWYSLEREGIHFVALDVTSPLEAGSAQYAWLESDLARVPAGTPKIVLLHYPLFSVSRHRAEIEALSSVLTPLFEKYRVAMVFSGHDHNYQRFYRNNIHYVVTGGGGAPLYDKEESSPYLQRFAKTRHFCVLSRKDGVLSVKVYDQDSALIDEFGISSSWAGGLKSD